MTSQLWPSIFVAALFAIHPLHVESVAWVSERKDTLSTTFVLVSIACYVRYARQWEKSWYLAFLASYSLSLLSKQMYVTLPALLLVLDWWPMKRVGSQKASTSQTDCFPHVDWSRALIEKLPPLVLAIAAALLIYNLQTPESSAKHSEFSPQQRLGNAVVAYTFYLQKTFVPTDLCFFYPFPSEGHSTSSILLCSGVLGTLVPVIGLVQVGFQAYADRYTYFPLIGIFIAVVWSIASIASGRPKVGGLAAVLGGAVLVILSIIAHQQVLIWQDNKTLGQHAVAIDPTNSQANAILAHDAFVEYRFDDAEKRLATAVQSPYSLPTQRINYGIVLLCQGDIEKAQKVFESVMAENLPHDGRSEFQLGIIEAGRGNLQEAVKLLTQSQEAAPNPFQAFSLAVVQARMGNLEQASQTLVTLPKGVSEFRLASELVDQMIKGNEDAKRRFTRIFRWPVTVQASRIRGSNIELAVVNGTLTPEEGLKQLQKSLELWPNNIDAMLQRAVLLTQLNRTTEARREIFHILDLDPGNEQAKRLLGQRPSVSPSP
jgi:tetratricopeptide (TPR) repeat protein